MRPLRAVGVVLSLSLAAAALPAADCTFDAGRVRTPQDRWREVSQEVELLAPSPFGPPAPHATTGGRRRAVTPSPAPTFVARNFIDEEIFGKMLRDGVRWTSPAGDEEFVRRIHLDLTGQIPGAAAVKAFLADTDPDKREKLIDSLLTSEEFAERWALWLGDHVQNTTTVLMGRMDGISRNYYYFWMKDSIRDGKPYDAMVREMLSALGAARANGAVVYWLRQSLPNPVHDTWDNLSADSAEKFLGLPLNCISCHNGLGHLEQVNSALVKRTRLDFWKNAAFFTQVIGTAIGQTAEFRLVENTAGGEYSLNTRSGNKSPREPSAGQPAVVMPAFFLTNGTPQPGEPRRTAYARMLTAHPQFARATVNYIWKQIFNLGIVEPADSHDLLRQDPATLPPGATLQPSHPELLTKLADGFIASNYSLRWLLGTMVTSSAYQLSARYTAGPWDDAWTPYFARRYARRLPAESLLDAVVRATNTSLTIEVGGGVPPFSRAVALPDTNQPTGDGPIRPFLTAFGRGDRDTTPRTQDASILQTLLMLNEPLIAQRVRAEQNSTTDRLLRTTRDPARIADELFVATLSRHPSANEKAIAVAYLASGDIVQNTEDLQFALINRLEFLYH